MPYALGRAIAGIALRWFYRHIEVQGIERIPRRGPLLFVGNHPNALVDALIVVWIVPRRVLLTAKATIFQNPLAARLLAWCGVLPLRRRSDEQSSGGLDPSRNEDTFRAVNDALRRGGAILIFPEGKSHDEPSIAPLKTGAARMALQARDSGAAPELAIVPIGLTFERKEAPRSRVLARVGEPIALNEWRAPPNQRPVESLTAEIDTRLRALTLNFPSAADASRAASLASVIGALVNESPPIGRTDRRLSFDADIARRVSTLDAELDAAGPAVRARADDLTRKLGAFQQRAAARGILLEDVAISIRRRDGTRFALREGWIVAIAAPLAVWGKVNHWLPFNTARVIAMRSVESAADPAMRTIVAGTVLVALAYLAQGLAVGALFGVLPASIYLLSLPVAAEANFYLSERLERARRRARTFFLFRRDPALRHSLTAELTSLRDETLALDAELSAAALRHHLSR